MGEVRGYAMRKRTGDRCCVREVKSASRVRHYPRSQTVEIVNFSLHLNLNEIKQHLSHRIKHKYKTSYAQILALLRSLLRSDQDVFCGFPWSSVERRRVDLPGVSSFLISPSTGLWYGLVRVGMSREGEDR